MLELALGLAVIALILAVANNYFHPQYKALVDRLAALEQQVQQKVVPAPTPAPNVSHVVTWTTPSAQPTGTITAPPAPDTFNGVPVPAGMTLAAFQALVLAVSGAASMLSNVDLHAALVNSSAKWWAEGVGPYFREALLRSATGDVLTAFRALANAGPALLSVTADQWAAADQAVAGK